MADQSHDDYLREVSPHLFIECQNCGAIARVHEDARCPRGGGLFYGGYPGLHGAGDPLEGRHLRSVE